MSEVNNDPPPGEEGRRSRFSGLHARTFEMELLLSGAVVFGLIHLPPVVERAFSSYRAGLEGGLRWVGIYGQVYVQLAVYGLIAAFVLHLVMRGFWIGLLGLESVYPRGIRWDRLKLGPFTIEHNRRKVRSLAHAVERADDLCSLVFSLSFMIVFTFVYSVVAMAFAAGLGFGLSWLVLGGESAFVLFWVILGLLLGIQILAQVVDRRFGERLRPNGLPGRVLDLVVRFAWATSPMRLTGATQLTLQSNLSDTRVAVLLIGGMLALVLVQSGGPILGEGVMRLDSLVYFPDNLREQGVGPGHYRSLRDPAAVEPTAPTIQSDVVTDPYLKLFLPYYPRRHNHLVAELCPDLDPISAEGLDIGARTLDDTRVLEAAACLGSLFQISLDGKRLEGLRFDFTREVGSGLEGVVSFLSMEGLEPGRHELEVLAPPRKDAEGADGGPPERIRHLIPFWR